jgi:hypothetical protein
MVLEAGFVPFSGGFLLFSFIFSCRLNLWANDLSDDHTTFKRFLSA